MLLCLLPGLAELVHQLSRGGVHRQTSFVVQHDETTGLVTGFVDFAGMLFFYEFPEVAVTGKYGDDATGINRQMLVDGHRARYRVLGLFLGFCDGGHDFQSRLAGEKLHAIAQGEDAASVERGDEELAVASVSEPRLFGVGLDALGVVRVNVNLTGQRNKMGHN